MTELEQLSIQIPETDQPRIVIIGGGFAGINFVKKLKKENVQIVMLDRHNYHTFQPLLYQVATAGLEPDSIAGPLRKIMEHYKNFFFRMTKVTSINPDRKTVSTVIGDLQYDYLIIACGTVTNFFGNDDLEHVAFPLKQIPQALDLRSHILQNFEKAVLTQQLKEINSLIDIVIVGGGPTGVEVAGALAELRRSVLPIDYPELDFNEMDIYLVEGLPNLLNGMSEKSSEKALKYLKKFDVNVLLNKIVKSYDGNTVYFDDGSVIESQTLIWAAGVKGNIINGLKEECIEKNRFLVDRYNRINGYKNIFAIGDIALMKSEENPKGHPQLAPVAIQQGKHLAKNVIKILAGSEMDPFNYFDKGTMATIGRNRAVVDLPGGLQFSGFFAWLIWMFVHLMSIVGFRNKLVTFTNWIWNYFTYDRGIRLIIRPFVKKENKYTHK